jgi:hypothetical protein
MHSAVAHPLVTLRLTLAILSPSWQPTPEFAPNSSRIECRGIMINRAAREIVDQTFPISTLEQVTKLRPTPYYILKGYF